MKGIILAGGTATRLFPLTATTSKQLLPVYDRQMIFYPLNVLVKAGIKEIMIIVAPDHSGQFLNLLGSIFSSHDIRLEFKVQKSPRGLADAFLVAENFIDHDDVTMVLGDNIFEDDFSPIIKKFKSGGHIFARKVPDPERYGVVKFNKNNNVLRIEEKPKKWLSDYAIPGLYIYDSRCVEAAKGAKPSERGEIEITEIHNYYLRRRELKVTAFDGAWLDAGTFDTLLLAGQIVKKKKISEKFDPKINAAIKEFNDELKEFAKKKLA
ncbi:MAG: sugar phosphate nucleotidyltransferase [Patescibacteria group bacterium]|jgi:glucose-1-phosphate thymidylyltransferase